MQSIYSIIFYKFPSKVVKSLCFISFSSIFWKAWISLSFKKNCSTFFIKITYLMVQCIFFSVFLANSYQEVIQFDTYCPFKDLIYCLFQGSNTNFHLKLILFGAQKFIKIVYNWENTVWPILSFQGSYRNFHWSSCIICCSNICQKTASGTLRFDPYCPFKDLIQISIKSSFFFGVQKFIQKIVSGTISGILYKCSSSAYIFFGVKNLLKNWIRDSRVWQFFPSQGFHQVFMKCWSLQEIWKTYSFVWPVIVHVENNDQYLSKAHITNSDQNKIWIERFLLVP